jgi:8-oxo-dGTP pyrophosphatase MutT (NUDIX family)
MLIRKIFNNTAHLILKPHKSKKQTISQIQKTVKKFIRNKQDTTLLHHNIDEAWHVFQAECIPVLAAGGLIKRHSTYLFIYRNGYWDLPKGKHDAGERIYDTAIRECCEECALSASKLKILKPLECTYHLYSLKKRPVLKTTFWFVMHYSGKNNGKPQISEGITKVQWFTKTQIKARLHEMYPSVQDLLKASVL